MIQLLIVLIVIIQQSYSFKLLKDVRKEASFLLPYSPEQKVMLAKQVSRILDVIIAVNL
jgi:hypothetical protein